MIPRLPGELLLMLLSALSAACSSSARRARRRTPHTVFMRSREWGRGLLHPSGAVNSRDPQVRSCGRSSLVTPRVR